MKKKSKAFCEGELWLTDDGMLYLVLDDLKASSRHIKVMIVSACSEMYRGTVYRWSKRICENDKFIA